MDKQPPRQSSMFDEPEKPSGEIRTHWDELNERAHAFHRANPWVWQGFCALAKEAFDRGFKHYSAYALFEVLRWQRATPAHIDPTREWKLNNDYRPFYARWYIEAHPELPAKWLRVRKQTSKDKAPVGLPPLGPGDYPDE